MFLLLMSVMSISVLESILDMPPMLLLAKASICAADMRFIWLVGMDFMRKCENHVLRSRYATALNHS